MVMVTTVPGLEDIVAEEVHDMVNVSKVEVRPHGLRGKVIVHLISMGDVEILLEKARSIERVILLLGRERVRKSRSGLKDLYNMAYNIELEEYLSPFTRFAVRAQREGVHEYTSPEMAKIVGEAVINRVRRVYRIRPPVNLDSPVVTVHVEVMDDEAFIGIDITGHRALHIRGYRVYSHPAALNPVIAYAMLKISGVKSGHRVLDPMCGGGTILIECALSIGGVELYGLDINPFHIAGAIKNAKAAGVREKIEFLVGDARLIDRIFKDHTFDRIVCNPPYGVRMSDIEDIKGLYEEFLSGARRVLNSEGILCTITLRHHLLRRISKALGYDIIHERTIYQGGLSPHILVLRPV